MMLGATNSIFPRFVQAIKNNRLAHAYLFNGPEMLGKTSAALALAKLVNCEMSPGESGPCEVCPSCRKIEKWNHPDVKLLKEDEHGSIKIEDVRDLIRSLQLKPYEGKKKVCIIRKAEHLTIEAANALLKTLEEPSAESLLILTTNRLEQVTDTVRSRCQIINFFALNGAKLAEKFIREDHWPDDAAYFLSCYSEGNPGLARQLYEGKLHQRKNEMIDHILLARDSEGFIKKIVTDKDRTRETLRVLISVIRDMILLKAGAEDVRLVNRDRISDLQKVSFRFSLDGLQDCFRQIVKTDQMLDENFNVKIALSIVKEKLWPE